jgi:hypothetical protein
MLPGKNGIMKEIFTSIANNQGVTRLTVLIRKLRLNDQFPNLPLAIAVIKHTVAGCTKALVLNRVVEPEPQGDKTFSWRQSRKKVLAPAPRLWLRFKIRHTVGIQI